MSDDFTEDTLLGGRLRLVQPRHGYRVAIDPVLLAAAVPAAAGETVLDAGAGTGAASLCLAARVPGCRVVGIELEREMQRIASHNADLNELARQIDVMVGDLDSPPPRLAGTSFDHVMSNPPYLPAAGASPSPVAGRTRANTEGIGLGRWLDGCLRLLKPGGRLTLVFRADRLDALLAGLDGKLGDIVVFPLWPTVDDRPAKRVLVQGRRGTRGPLRLVRGLVLHERDGRYTEAADAVLREGRPLPLIAETNHG